MDYKVYFKWLPSINISEEYEGIGPDSFLEVIDVWTGKSLDELAKAAKSVEDLNSVKVVIGEEDNVVFNSVATPVQLVSRLSIHGYRNEYKVSDEGPSLEWLLRHKEELNNPNKVFYVDDMAVCFLPDYNREHAVTITVFSIKHMDAYIDALEDHDIEGLDESLEYFLERCGYTDESMYKSIAKVILTFQAIKKLDFPNAEEVVAHFCDKHLIADLKLKGVFEGIKERYY